MKEIAESHGENRALCIPFHTDVIFKSSLYKVFTIRLKVYFYWKNLPNLSICEENKIHAGLQ